MSNISVPTFARPVAPGVVLTPWFRADDMETLPTGRDHFGVYFLARMDVAPAPADADPLDASIVYIGKASKGNQYMNRRAWEFREARRADGLILLQELYVAYCPVECDTVLLSHTLTMALERLFIHNWTCAAGRLPPFNKE